MKRRVRKVTLILLLVVGFSYLSLHKCLAGIYKYVDERGVIHITNIPKGPKYRLIIASREDLGTTFNGRSITINRIRLVSLESYIKKISRQYRIDPALIKAIIKVESDFDPWATSAKGAVGLMQLMPETIRDLGLKNPFDPYENILGGTRHLSRLLSKYNFNTELALAAYNAGEKVVETYGNIPPYSETRRYVKRVLYYFRHFRSVR